MRRRDFLEVIVGLGITVLNPFSLKNTVVKNSDIKQENLEDIIKKVKEKYKDVDFDEEINLSYDLKIEKIWGVSIPSYIKRYIGATASFKLDKNEGSLEIKSDIFFAEANYEIRTFYHNNEITHLQIMDGIHYYFIKRGDKFNLLPDEDRTTNTFDEKIKQDFSTTATDVITAAKNILYNPKGNERIFLEDYEFNIPIDRQPTDREELDKIIFDLSGFNTVTKNVEYNALKLNGKFLPVYGTVYVEGTWLGIPYNIELYGQITI